MARLPTYSIVSPVYNVEKYLGAFLDSLAGQTAGFSGRLEVIFVDDGSEDNSVAILEKEFPRAITLKCLRKRNGGRASARNLGLRHASGDWVTFADPDDLFSEGYFQAVDAFLCGPQSVDLGMLCCRRIFFWDRYNMLLDKHHLRSFFRNGPQLYPASSSDFYPEASCSSVFYKREILFQNKHFFKEDIRPFFEDTEFNIFYMLSLRNQGLSVGLAPDAIYKYRIRQEVSSFMELMKDDAAFYSSLFDNGYIRTLQTIRDDLGHIPEFAQQMVLTSLKAQASFFSSSAGSKHYKKTTDSGQLHQRLHDTLCYCDPGIISKSHGCSVPDPLGSFLCEHYLKISDKRTWLHVTRVDPIKRQLKVTHTGENAAVFLQGGKTLEPAYSKRRRRVFLDQTLPPEHIFWLPIENLGEPLRVKGVNGAVRFDLAGRDMGETFLPSDAIAVAKPPAAAGVSGGTIRHTAGKQCWVFADSFMRADDNAEHLYWHVFHNHQEIEAWFVLDEDSPDYDRMRDRGASLVLNGSAEHVSLLSRCDCLISSHQQVKAATDSLASLSGVSPSYLFCFLDHGVIKSDMSATMDMQADFFATSTFGEFQSLVRDNGPYPFTKKEVILTGLARFDALLREPPEPERLLMVMPTWRSYLPSCLTLSETLSKKQRRQVENSHYFATWKSFFHSRGIASTLQAHGYRLFFWPHKMMQSWVSLFELPPYIETVDIQSPPSIQDIFRSASIFLTDYTSAAFDVALLRRHIIYFHFEGPRHLDGTHNMEIADYFDYECDGFGPIVHTEQELQVALEAACRCGGEVAQMYLDRIDATFPFQDTNHCLRTYEAIRAMFA